MIHQLDVNECFYGGLELAVERSRSRTPALPLSLPLAFFPRLDLHGFQHVPYNSLAKVTVQFSCIAEPSFKCHSQSDSFVGKDCEQ